MNSLTLTDIHNNSFTFEKLKLTGFEYPEVINVVEDVGGRNGAIYIASKFSKRRLSWEGILQEDVLANRREMQKVIAAGALKTLSFETCDGVEVQVDVEVERLTMPYYMGPTKYLIEAVAPDYRFFDQNVQTLSLTETGVTGGAQIPATIPMSLSSAAQQDNTIDNEGTTETPPTLIIYGPGSEFVIRNQTTGVDTIITYDLLEGQFIVVDVANRTVLLNGQTSIYTAFSGFMWFLQPGENIIGFTPTGEGVTTHVDIQWRNAYLGI